MSQASDCSECCTTPPAVQVPGPQGAAGTDGAAGANAFTLTTSDFVIPAVAASVTVAVANNSFMAVGQTVFASDGTDVGSFQVVSLTGTTTASLKFMGYTGDSAPGATINAGAKVTPSGVQGTSPSTPISIANGGTAAATKAAAQTSLGVGQNALTANSSGLTQVITNAFAEVGTCDVTVLSVGLYLILAKAVVTMAGVTFAASRTITLRVRNVTQGTTIATADFATQILTTQNEPALEIQVPFITDSAAVANDHYQLQITIDTANSAGTLSVVSGSLVAIPLRLS
jgi:hypothetical protein